MRRPRIWVAAIISFILTCLMFVGYAIKGIEMDFFESYILLSLFINETLKE